jgi:hypothetical protein
MLNGEKTYNGKIVKKLHRVVSGLPLGYQLKLQETAANETRERFRRNDLDCRIHQSGPADCAKAAEEYVKAVDMLYPDWRECV